MTTHADTLQRDIDRLVSGELDKTGRRELVQRLNTEADAWKRCALAYMEAQSWQRAFGELVEESGPVVEPLKPTPQPDAKPRSQRTVLAAGLLLGIVLGLGSAFGWSVIHGSPQPDSDNIARPDDRQQPVPNRKKSPIPNDEQQPFVGLVQVTTNGVQETAFAVAAIEGNVQNVDFAPAKLPEYERQVWARRGYRIEQHRKVVRVLLADGKRLQFPVDWNNLRYVGERIY